MKDLITVIIPTFKRPEKLLRTVKSVVNQSYKNLEILVVNDDLSNDDLLVGFKDERLKIIQNERSKGANGARNTGIINAKGYFIAFLDDDDEWLPNYAETQIKCLKETGEDVGLVYGSFLLEVNDKWIPRHQNITGNILAEFITDQFRIGASSNIFIKKEIIDKIGFWDEEMARQQDLEFLSRVFKNYKVVCNQEVVLKIYGHNDPDPEKTFVSREKFYNKILPHLDEISEDQKALFYSNHFRRQTNFLIKMRSFEKAKKYWLKAFGNKKISVRKDGKILISLLKSF